MGSKNANFPVLSRVIREFDRRESLASDCVIHISVSRFLQMSEIRSKSARVRAICDHAWTRRTPETAGIARIGQNLSGHDLPRSADHRHPFASPRIRLQRTTAPSFSVRRLSASRNSHSTSNCGSGKILVMHESFKSLSALVATIVGVAFVGAVTCEDAAPDLHRSPALTSRETIADLAHREPDAPRSEMPIEAV